jgi:H+/Cl- antiporter ClcA
VPVAGASPFVLREQTWRPFDRVPWLAERPWLPLPPFAVVAAAVAARAWLRSRAWNRRLPSMTRHDREFVGRVVTLLVLAAGLAWQVYEGWYAATGPSLVPEAWWAGSLASLPLLLVPPALYLAALALDLSPAPHRGAWALVALLAGAASVFNVAVAMTGTVTNLTLSYSLLLALLAVLALPRAFSRGRMGWSRQAFPGAA